MVSRSERAAFVARKLFSLSGLVPVGAFVVLHVWTYAQALGGRGALEAATGKPASLGLVVEVFLIWVPLMYHAAYGLKVTAGGRPNLVSYPYPRNWSYFLGRLTGIVSLVFIVYHVSEYRLPLATGALLQDDIFPRLCASLSSTSAAGVPFVALMYLVGVAATSYHLAQGLSGFCFSWGVTVTRRAQRLASAFAGIVGLAVFWLGASTVLYFATGARLAFPAYGGESGPPPLHCADVREER